MRVELRQRRIALGLTQLELAAAADVSRQLVAAVEAGVNVPAADAAVRLAQALECTVEELFAADEDGWGPAAISPGALVVAGCDPALALAERMLSGASASGSRPNAQLVAIDATSGTALASLDAGAIHAAVVHGLPEELGDARVDLTRVKLAAWRVGLGLAPGLSALTLEQVLDAGMPLVQRPESASSQRALRRAAEALGYGQLPAGAVASSHHDAARAAAALGSAALTTEGAARQLGLRFVGLEEHTVELWLAARWREHPAFEALLDLLVGRAYNARVSRLGGYDLTGCGTVLSSSDPARALSASRTLRSSPVAPRAAEAR
ncbi:MAG: helix-turn-helix domain-containing protein [Actinomycetota bacterium]|nr:helix-turn-helix domain-containing protein [Actinomycetota bacterium]